MLKDAAKLEYAVLRVLFRLFLGKKRRNKLFNDKVINIDELMAKHFMNKDCGFIKSLKTKDCLYIFSDGFWVIGPLDEGHVVQEVKRVYLKPKQGDVVIDVGAHYGFYTLLSSRLVGKEGSVIAFEPSHKNYRGLLTNLLLNKTRNVKSFNIALGDFNGEVKLYLFHQAGGHSIVYQRSERFEFVPIKKLDTIINELGVSKVSLIKLDAEGAELKILKGALSTIKKYRPRLTIAAYHYPTESKEIVEWLKENAPFYRIARVDRGVVFLHAV